MNINNYLYLLIIAIFYLFLFSFAGFNFAIDQNEGWYFFESYYFSEGELPYRDYFSHRLPLHQIIYGMWFKITHASLLNARILSILFSLLSIIITSLILLKITRDKYILVINFLFFLNFTVFSGLTLNQIYPLTSFLYSLSLLTLYVFRNNLQRSVSLFFIFQILILFTQYPVSPQLVLIFMFLLLICIYTFYFKVYFLGTYFVFLIGTLLSTYLIFLVGLDKIIYHTITFNFNQVNLAIERGIWPSNLYSYGSRFMLQRKNEILEFLPYLPLVFLITVWGSVNILNLLKSCSADWKSRIYLYSLVYFASFYIPLIFLGYDFPITKVYTIFPILILLVPTFLYLQSFNSKISIGIKIFIILLLVLFVLQQVSLFMNKNNQLYEQNFIGKRIDNLSNRQLVLTFDPLLVQNNILIDKTLSMSHYSLLHSLDQTESKIYHLGHINNIKENIKNRVYKLIILDEKNFYNEKNADVMSKIFDGDREELLDLIYNNYYLFETHNLSRFHGKYDIFKLK